MPETKKYTLGIRLGLVPWIQFAAGLHGCSQTEYINVAIERDLESADEDTKAAYAAFLKARQSNQ